MEIKITSRALCWLFGRSRTPLHEDAIRLVDIRKRDTVHVCYNKGSDNIVTFTSKPYLRISWYRSPKRIVIGWWIDCEYTYEGQDRLIKKDGASLQDMGIARSFAPYIYPDQHWTPFKYATLLF